MRISNVVMSLNSNRFKQTAFTRRANCPVLQQKKQLATIQVINKTADQMMMMMIFIKVLPI